MQRHMARLSDNIKVVQNLKCFALRLCLFHFHWHSYSLTNRTHLPGVDPALTQAVKLIYLTIEGLQTLLLTVVHHNIRPRE